MLSKLFEWFKAETESPSSAPRVDLAAAVLMVEVTMADHRIEPEEDAMLRKLFRESLNLSEADVEKLMVEALAEQEQTLDLYQYTRVINDSFGAIEKFELMVDFWLLGFADGHVDRYEDYMVRKVADLLYVPHSDFMMAKQEARTRLGL
ncbi:TerB family tellurite resistance protein [Salinispirillum sp. LH 10-3-1]|uniref:TerB family tellurite resistance protein n=1 Tax=Salinispirillum sp. LH 10-3-1 TaxID=2952525 RepID=A0AB38YJ65_9GAMM